MVRIKSSDGCKPVEIGRTSIRKTYFSGGAARIAHLKKIYGLLESRGVPNVDSLDNAILQKDVVAVVQLSPKGTTMFPANMKDLLEAAKCIFCCN